MDSIDDIIAARTQRRDHDPETEDVDLEGATGVLTLRFTEMDGFAWVDITGKNPPRLDVPLDVKYGYNFHKVALHAAPMCGGIVTEDGVIPITPEAWVALAATFTGHDMQQVSSAIWAVNEWRPANRIVDQKKASRAAAANMQPSPAKSASPRAASQAASRAKSRRSSTTKKGA